MDKGWILILLLVALPALAFALFGSRKKKTYNNLGEKIDAIKDKASIDSGLLSATVDRITIQANTDRNIAVTDQIRSMVDLESAASTAPFQIQRAAYDAQHLEVISKHQLDHAEIVQDRQHELFLAESENVIVAFNAATALQLPAEAYAKVAELVVTDNHRLRIRWEEKQQDLKAAFIFKHQDFQLLDMLLEYVKGLYVKADVETGRSKTLTENHIKFMEGIIDERQRLLQADARSRVSGGNPDSDG